VRFAAARGDERLHRLGTGAVGVVVLEREAAFDRLARQWR
jgi:hypothetical protein